MELLEKLDKKIEDVDNLIDLKKKEAGLTGKVPTGNYYNIFLQNNNNNSVISMYNLKVG